MDDTFAVRPVGRVRSPLADRDAAPRQGDEGAPEAWVVFEPDVTEAMRDLAVGDEVILLTWLDRASREVLVVHPRSDLRNPPTGVFSTRSPDRPNPIGLHTVEILEIAALEVRVRNLEAIDGTPVLDVKPVLGPIAER